MDALGFVVVVVGGIDSELADPLSTSEISKTSCGSWEAKELVGFHFVPYWPLCHNSEYLGWPMPPCVSSLCEQYKSGL